MSAWWLRRFVSVTFVFTCWNVIPNTMPEPIFIEELSRHLRAGYISSTRFARPLEE